MCGNWIMGNDKMIDGLITLEAFENLFSSKVKIDNQ